MTDFAPSARRATAARLFPRHFLLPLGLALIGLAPRPAASHALAGARVFPVTLTMDDPGVSDEASLPTATWQRSGAADGNGPSNEYDFNFEFDKRITTNLGVSVNDDYHFTQITNAKNQSGFGNVYLTGKYQTYVDPEGELIISTGVQRELGRTGDVTTGADQYGGTQPLFYIGKGLGQLPVPLLRPLAVTGELGRSFADVGLKVAPDGTTNGGNEDRWFGAFSVQYSIPYLQSQVHDYGLPALIAGLTPLVEVTWSSPATAPANQGTTLTIAPGVIYTGQTYSVGVEALIPANRTTGSNVGVIAQFHLFLDDIFPDSIGKPIFE